MEVFAKETILLQHSFLGYLIDAYSHRYKWAIEVDEKSHIDRDEEKKLNRQNAKEKELGSEFIRINPVKKGFNRDIVIDKIYNYIIK